MPRMPCRLFVALVLMAGTALLSCGRSGSTPPLAPPGISSVVITAVGTMNARAQAVAVQSSDQKVVAAGSSYDGAKNVFALTRYNTDGSLDAAGFGTGGIVTTAIGTVDDQAQALVIQPSDGKLVVAGFSYDGAQNVFALARYNTDGSLDAGGFGTGGIVTTAIGSVDDRAFAVAIQSTGEIVAAGYSSEDTGAGIRSRLALVRYKTDGTPDNTFDSDGIVILDSITIPSSTGAFALTIQTISAVDYLVAAGFAHIGAQDEFLLVRYDLNGNLDANFNSTGSEPGVVTSAIGAINDRAFALAIQTMSAVDYLVAAGSSYAAGQSSIALARYTTAGILDTTFNTTGKVTTAILTDAAAFALAIQPDTKIVVAGSAYNNTYSEFVLARYDSTGSLAGSLDGTFGSGGKVHTAITYGAEAFGLAIQGDGKPVAAGYSQAQLEPEKFTLVRYSDTDGSVDPGFVTP
jgi:uncharacterized delta-60 repeat protein